MNARAIARAVSIVALLGVGPGTLAGGGNLEVKTAWSRATPPVSGVGAAYLAIENHGGEADRLIGASSPVADRVEMHTTRMEGGMMKMRELGPVDIGPGATVEFKPGGHHLMLMGLAHPLEEGEEFPLTLTFEHAGAVRVQVQVQGMGASHGATGMDHAHMEHGVKTGDGTEARAPSHQHGAASLSSQCHLPVVLSEEAEKRAGGALYRAPSSKEATTQLKEMSHADHIKRADPKHHHHDAQQHDDPVGMHSIHERQFGGRSFFMAPNKLHHLEPLYSDECGFRLVLYNAYTQPIAVNRFRAFIKMIPEDQDLPEMIRFLSPSADGNLLVAAITPRVPPPFEIELYLKFPEADEPELFNIKISTP